MKLKNVVIVDDQENICNLVKASLENVWPTLKVTTCSDSTRAIEKIRALDPDLVILDVEMPQVSGPDIAQTMRETPCLQEIPILFLTGILTPDEARSRVEKDNGIHYLAKPIDFKELVSMVEKHIR